eukprot:m.37451 g.37451  ORF g.37451 m.37451 type:complete len:456 (+) comp16252_c0_seq1:44-1411(+)
MSVLILLLLVAGCQGLVQLPAHMRGGRALQMRANVSLRAEAVQKTFSVPLNHSDPNSSSFEVYYYVDESYASDSNIAFMIMGGEGPLGGIGNNYITYLAKEYGATVVAIEHRFYGKSLPHGGLSRENLNYLTVSQALADVAALIDLLNKDHADGDFTWFTFGGSYSGALSAWFRISYPTHTQGSLSSSGVVNAILNFTGFDEQVAVAVGPECTTRLQEITKAFEDAYFNGHDAEARALFNAPDDMLPGDFFYMIADSAAMADQYGSKKFLCDSILQGGSSPSPEALMSIFANFTKSLWGPDFGANCFYDTKCLQSDESKWQPTSRSWRWQKCSELAYFQVAPAQHSIRSHVVNFTYHMEQCEAVFGPITPATDAINAKYGGATPKGSRIFFSDFSDDPWQRASVTQKQSADLPFHLVTCDGCGHCDDFSAPSSSDPPALKEERADFETYLKQWLE